MPTIRQTWRALELCGPQGLVLWDAELLIEDQAGLHIGEWTAGDRNGHGTAKAGPWRIKMHVQPAAGGLARLSLRLGVERRRRCRRLCLRLRPTEHGHRLLWNDPDFAIVRSAATTADPNLNIPYKRRPLQPGGGHWMAGPDASFEELKAWLAIVYLTGGSLFLSDSIPRLNRLGLDRGVDLPAHGSLLARW